MPYTRIDSAYPPTLAEAQAAKAAGVVEWAGYIPAPRVLHAWSKADFDVLRQAGLEPVFISTGYDALADVPSARACGIRPGEKLCLDVEAGWNDTYSANWAGGVKASGYETELYGLRSETTAHGYAFDLTWFADYTGTPPASLPANTGQQYENSHTEFGVSVDRSLMNEPLTHTTEIAELTLDLARLLVMGWYISILHRVPSQAEVDFWAGKLVAPGANFEAVMTTFYQTPEAATDIAEAAHPVQSGDPQAEQALKDAAAAIQKDLPQ